MVGVGSRGQGRLSRSLLRAGEFLRPRADDRSDEIGQLSIDLYERYLEREDAEGWHEARIQALGRMATESPSDASVRFHLSIALRRTDPAESWRQLLVAVLLNPDYAEVARAMLAKTEPAEVIEAMAW